MADQRFQEYVEYYLFPHLPNSSDNKLRKEALEAVADTYIAQLSDYLVDYIWQNEPFKLTVVDNGQSYLYGRTEYGDNIEDEWFIVFLLLHLTEKFSDLVVRVADTDGEFLLIEAADHLQKWMKPESCERRVYLYQGAVHILPVNGGQPTALQDAVAAIRESSNTTKMDSNVQRTIQKRTACYPNKIKENHHRAHCYIPAAVAAILNAKPSLLSAAVNAFYLRDPIDLKACCAMKYFPPETRVMTEVVFTRCLYAQTLQQKYIPDKRVGWNLPLPNSPEFKSWDLGMKLACGFEILAAGARDPRGSVGARETEVDLSLDLRFSRYVNSLKEKGFFREQLEHSVLYNELLAKAKAHYVDYVRDTKESRHSPGEDVLHLLNTLEADVEQMRKNEKKLNPPDDDEWLNLSADQLDAMLKAYENRGDAATGKATSRSNENENLSNNVASGLKTFVSHVSSHEGAEFPKMRNPDKANRNNRITFDPDSFVDAMQSILDFKLPEWEGDDCSNSSGMSDYGDESDELDLSKPAKSSKKMANGVSGMKDYMDQMDRELANTVVGQSFERTQQRGETAAEAATCSSNGTAEHADVDDDGYRPVDVDLTALKNILESYGSQQGLPGPASNLLGTMGINLPQNVDRLDC